MGTGRAGRLGTHSAEVAAARGVLSDHQIFPIRWPRSRQWTDTCRVISWNATENSTCASFSMFSSGSFPAVCWSRATMSPTHACRSWTSRRPAGTLLGKTVRSHLRVARLWLHSSVPPKAPRKPGSAYGSGASSSTRKASGIIDSGTFAGFSRRGRSERYDTSRCARPRGRPCRGSRTPVGSLSSRRFARFWCTSARASR